MSDLPTPISIFENYFGDKLLLKNITRWKKVSDDEWLDFTKRYREQMKAGFTPQAIAEHVATPKIRLYFHYTFGENYDREILQRYPRTPLLGNSPYPDANVEYIGDGLSHALAPLRKHLLAADELVLPDHFYQCFDFMAETYPQDTWRQNPYMTTGVRQSVTAILQWLPILAGLRKLITSHAIVFLPYYAVPSFPYVGGNQFIEKQIMRLDVPRNPQVTPIEESKGIDLNVDWNAPPPVNDAPPKPRLDCTSALYAWVSAALLGLDPVFADSVTWQWASRVKFRETTTANLTSDLMSIDILPLKGKKGKELSLQDIVAVRNGEAVFGHVRDTLNKCKEHVLQNVQPDATDDFITSTCRTFIRDHLDSPQRLKSLKFVNSNVTAATVLSIAISAAFMTANPWVGLAVPAALTPQIALAIEGAINPRIRALTRLDALL